MVFQQLLASAAALIICCAITLASAGPQLPPDEVEGLKQIAKTLRKTDWDFSVDPCSGERGWIDPDPVRGRVNAVTCDCSNATGTICHVVSIVLKGQNLSGTVPPELVKLPYLQEIDLTRNYLNGTIPPQWGSMQLVNISLLANRVSGTIPNELGNISTLAALNLEINQLSGTIPPELGNLSRIERLTLTSNNLTGKLPEELAKLTTLRDFRIGDNQFSGSIPNFIQNWTNIQKLLIQASGLTGPIPNGIASLTKLTDLRISDLDQESIESTFPPLNNATSMKILILRSCGIVGQLPDYLGSMTKLKILDLSYNGISGQIPNSWSGLSNTDYIYLSRNFLSGPVPDWMLKSGSSIDLSINLFTFQNSGASSCQIGNVNLYASSSRGNALGMVSCLRNFHCPRNWRSFHTNCGGREVEVDSIRYENDTVSGLPSKFFQSSTNWAYSSTGHFMDDDRLRDPYIWRNSSMISGNNPDLYMDARISPLSLTYYGFCLLNGNYTVKLHFAEIMFTDDKTYSSLGRRIFDIYIQGMLVLKDFNIENEAGGVNKPIVKLFNAPVIDNTLEIHFYWAGKGTNGIPERGVYGPLISAISVDSESDLMPPPEHRNQNKGAIVGIVIAIIFAISLLLIVLWWKGCLPCKNKMEQDLKEDIHIGFFTLRQIKAATNNFNAANKIGEGGFGSVYKGNLSDGINIAVKQLSSKSKQGNREFLNEIGMISALQHPNLVELYGCCIEGNELLLVYEYMENNSLARALFGPEECQLKLDWPTRHKICVGVARGLAYLHEESRFKIVHRDIKGPNVLLDKNLNPKISDFGLAKLTEEENSHITTRIAGTFGYMAPEYAMSGYLTYKADVYSFGVVLLEIVSGKSNTSVRLMEDCLCLLDWARFLKEKGRLMELVDSKLGLHFDQEEVMLTINVALLCSNVSPTARPSMSTVVSMLEGRVTLVSDSSVSSHKMETTAIDDHQHMLSNTNESQTQSMSTAVPCTAFSIAKHDHYPVGMDTCHHLTTCPF